MDGWMDGWRKPQNTSEAGTRRGEQVKEGGKLEGRGGKGDCGNLGLILQDVKDVKDNLVAWA
jgi:hypothetical protein